MSNIYLISDTHFMHENMYKFEREDGTRVRSRFKTSVEGDAFMVEAWNAVVKPPDKVYHLGDVALSIAGLDFMKFLNGKHRLILGNHDKYKMRYYEAVGFEDIYASRLLDGVLMTHIPVHPNHLPFRAIGNAHGHIHHRESPEGPYFNCSVEQIDYTPIHFEVVRQCLKEE